MKKKVNFQDLQDSIAKVLDEMSRDNLGYIAYEHERKHGLAVAEGTVEELDGCLIGEYHWFGEHLTKSLQISNIEIINNIDSYADIEILIFIEDYLDKLIISNCSLGPADINQENDTLNELSTIDIYAEKCDSITITKCEFKELEMNLYVGLRDASLMKFIVDDNRDFLIISDSHFKRLSIEYSIPIKEVDEDLLETSLTEEEEEERIPKPKRKISKENKEYVYDTKLIRNTIAEDACFFSDVLSKVDFSLALKGNTIMESLILQFIGDSNRIKEEYNFALMNKNIISKINVRNNYPNVVDWGLGEKIGEKILDNSSKQEIHEGHARKLISHHKKVFTKFKNIAVEKGDRLQENALNYHITKCDELLLEEEEGLFQEKIIMRLGRLLSRHGTSWRHPLTAICLCNLLIAASIFGILCLTNLTLFNHIDFFNIFFSLFNPLSTPTSIVNIVDENLQSKSMKLSIASVSFFVFLAKAIYAVCIYELVRAARRFTLK